MKRVIIILCISFGFLSVGCGAKQGETTSLEPSSPVDEYLLDLAPENPSGILWIDVAEFRASPLGKALQELSKSDDGVRFFEDAKKVGFADPLAQINEILLIFTHETEEFPSYGGGDHLFVLLKGTFDTNHIIATLRDKGHGRAVGEGERAFEINGFPAVREGEHTFLAITDRTLAIATPQSANRLAKRARGGLGLIQNNPQFKDLVIGGEEAVKIRYRRGPVESVAANRNPDSGPLALDGLTALDAVLSFGQGLDLQADLHVENKMEASKIKDELEIIRGDFANNMLAVMIGVEWLADRITIRASGKSVGISVALNAQDMEQLTQLVDRLQKIKRLLETGDQSSPPQTTAPPAPEAIPDSGSTP